MVQNFADVLSEQVSGNASCKSILGPVRGSACGFLCFVVPGVRNNQLSRTERLIGMNGIVQQ